MLLLLYSHLLLGHYVLSCPYIYKQQNDFFPVFKCNPCFLYFGWQQFILFTSFITFIAPCFSISKSCPTNRFMSPLGQKCILHYIFPKVLMIPSWELVPYIPHFKIFPSYIGWRGNFKVFKEATKFWERFSYIAFIEVYFHRLKLVRNRIPRLLAIDKTWLL